MEVPFRGILKTAKNRAMGYSPGTMGIFIGESFAMIELMVTYWGDLLG
jgi:hypothetical protein